MQCETNALLTSGNELCPSVSVLHEMCSFDLFLCARVCTADRDRAAKETHADRAEDRHTNRDILKYRKERAKIQETSISLMDGSILESHTCEPDGGQARKQDSADE